MSKQNGKAGKARASEAETTAPAQEPQAGRRVEVRIGTGGPAPSSAAKEAAPAREAPSGVAPPQAAAEGPAEGTALPSLDPRLQANIERIEALTRRLVEALAGKRFIRPGLQAPGPGFTTKAALALWAEMFTRPEKVLETQMSYWGETLRNWAAFQEALLEGEDRMPSNEGARDRRFANPLWETHPWFRLVRDQYLANAKLIEAAVDAAEGLDAAERQRLRFFARQIVELMSPTNFLATNPDALERALATDGESLIEGLENLVRDLERNRGELVVSLADPEAFEVGRDLATTPGGVVWRNRMFELIQYAPTTEKVHRTPLLVFPPWINKYYILDLRPQNSFVKWAVDQGFTVFMVSWVNPDSSYRDVGLDTYVEEGFLAAMREVRAITGEDRINLVGYCIAGTTLSATLAWMAAEKRDWVRSASFFTTLTDFTEPGEVGVFLEDDFLDALDREVEEKGCLDRFFMQRTFSFLRPRDLVYGPAVRAYLLGEKPPAFDLLYWNGDSTNLPARMAHEYLREWCVANRLARGEYELLGRRISLGDVKVPLCSVACEADHIAPWKSVFRGFNLFGSRTRRFILSESGHVAGIVNPPGRKKYGHWLNDGAPLRDPDEWRAGAQRHEGSWWPEWGRWLARRSGAKIPARPLGGPDHPVLEPAPGRYVRMSPDCG